MNCRQSQRLLSAYIDRELAGDEMLAVRTHLDECHECCSELEDLKKLKTMMASAKTVAPDPGVYSRMKTALHGPTLTRTQRQRGWSLMALTACASALGVALVMAQAEDKRSEPQGLMAESQAPLLTSNEAAMSDPDDSVVQMYTVKY